MEEFKINNNSKKWIDLCTPKNTKDIVGHKSAIEKILEWLKKYDSIDCGKKNKNQKENSSCMIVSGSHGIGKTCTVITILKSLKYDVNTINFNKIVHSKNPKEFAKKILRNKNVFNITQETGYKKALVIDDTESITSTIDRKFIEMIIKENENIRSFPVIFIANNKHNKFINNIKHNTYKIYMDLPTKENLKFLLLKICCKNKMILSSEKVANMIIDHCQYDYRRLLAILEDFYSTYGNKKILPKHVNKYFEFSKKKDIDINIYKSTETLFTDKSLSIEDRLVTYETERTILPLMVHQNHITCVDKYLIDDTKTYAILEDITESIAVGDVVENHIYGDQNWSLQETHGFYTCIYPSFLLSKNIDSKVMKNDLKYKRYNIEFPLDLNRTSIKYINMKNIKNAINEFPNMDIYDFINVKTILKKLLEDDNMEKFNELLSNYSVTSAGIHSVIKVDKISDTKTNIPTLISKKINEFLKAKT
jgi:hypothetical protein